MSDTNAASIFAMMFEILAEKPTDDNKETAARFFSYANKFDFEIREMYADEALIALGLIDGE